MPDMKYMGFRAALAPKIEEKRTYRVRSNLKGHSTICNGDLVLSIRHEDGQYRIVRACSCGAVSQPGLHLFNSHGEAWAVLKLIAD